MSTRNFNDNPNIKTRKLQDEYTAPDDFQMPSCTIEDVDRALFSLFDNQLPFTYKSGEGTRRAPVIFATGERFAILRRKRPLRDKTGVLILPLVSIMRTGIEQTPTMGMGTNQSLPIVLRRKLSENDSDYQKILNKQGFVNSSDHAVKAARVVKISDAGPRTVSENPSDAEEFPDRLMTTSEDTIRGLSTSKGLEAPSLGNNIFEIITLAPPKYYTATYDITFWAQYTKQMNDMIMSMMSMYQSYSQRSFKVETPKGYWFVAYINESLSPGNNFDDFSDNERLVRYSFSVNIPAYIIGDVVPGGQSMLKRTLSAPIIKFGIETVSTDMDTPAASNIPSGDPNDYILEDIRTVDEPLPGQSIGGKKSIAAVDQRGPEKDESQAEDEVGGEKSRDESEK